MPVVRNFITGDSFSLLGSVGLWSLDAGNGSIESSTTRVKYSDIGSLAVTSDDGNAVTIAYSGSTVDPEDGGWVPCICARVWTPSSISASTAITVATVSDTNSSSSTSDIGVGSWSTLTAAGAHIADTSGQSIVSFKIEITGLGAGETAYITAPALTFPGMVTRNLIAADSWLRLPVYMQEADAVQSNPDLPLLRFLDALTTYIDDVAATQESIRYIPPDAEGGEKLSTLASPSVAPIEILPWLAMIVGASLRDPSTGFTSWGNLEAALDTWTDWETIPDVDLDGTEWSEIESFNTGVAGLIDYLRSQVTYAYYGLSAGTTESMERIVTHFLIDDGNPLQVAVIPHYGADPWAIQIQTLTDQTPGVTGDGQSSGELLEALAPTVPAGYELVHTSVASI